MASPIDPITGLPMVGVADVVSQIPLGVQVVPWDDTKAVDRPQGGPAYPNDIINTFAWVTGENVSQPGTIHAGTMTPDRRLRVDTGGGGGAGPITVTQQNAGSTIDGGYNDMAFGVVTYPDLIYTLSASVKYQTTPPTNVMSDFQVYIRCDQSPFTEFDLIALSIASYGAGAGFWGDSGALSFPGGLNPWSALPPSATFSAGVFRQGDTSAMVDGLVCVGSGPPG